MANILLDGNFFRIYAFHNLISFNIFSHTEKLVCLHYILSTFPIFHNNMSPLLLQFHKVCIFHYDIHLGIDGGSWRLFFFDKIAHMSEVIDLFQTMGLCIFHRSNNTQASVHYTKSCIECNTS